MLSPSGSSRFAAGKRVVLRATCCPLPASDILTNEHIVAEQSCPENFVATGAMRECPENVAFEDESSTCSYPLRCTKLNMTRYQLGRREPGVFWGTGATFWKESKTILKSDIPLAIRLAMGRINKFSWVQSGCLGSPSGSLFVEKQSKRCHGMIYQQLLFRGLPGDPAAGTPVPMYPQCDTLNHKYSSQPECIVYKRDEVDQVPRVSDDMGH